MPPRKTLSQHIWDGSFRPSRHARLLESEEVPPEFAHFAQRYQRATSDRERRAAAGDLLEAIRAEPLEPELAMAQEFYGVFGPDSQLVHSGQLSIDEYHQLSEAWAMWAE